VVYSSDNIYDLVYGEMLKGAKQMSEKRYINYREWWNQKGHLISDKRECALEAWDAGLNANYEEDKQLQQQIEELEKLDCANAEDLQFRADKIFKLKQENARLKDEIKQWKIDFHGEYARVHELCNEIGPLRNALDKIIKNEGKVCPEYEICKHESCRSSHASWEIAKAVK